MTSVLPVRQAYHRWAWSYEDETAVTILDEAAVAQLWAPVNDRYLLDAGCGTGRRLAAACIASAPRCAVGVDLVPAMLTARRDRIPAACLLAAADVRALPCPAATFDVIWCRLVAGHVPELQALYGELARVAAPGSVAIVTDFHPAAARRGHERTFRDAAGMVHTVEHVVHEAADHERAAAQVGWTLERRIDMPIGPPVRSCYAASGVLDRYVADSGLPLVLGLRFVR